LGHGKILKNVGIGHERGGISWDGWPHQALLAVKWRQLGTRESYGQAMFPRRGNSLLSERLTRKQLHFRAKSSGRYRVKRRMSYDHRYPYRFRCFDYLTSPHPHSFCLEQHPVFINVPRYRLPLSLQFLSWSSDRSPAPHSGRGDFGFTGISYRSRPVPPHPWVLFSELTRPWTGWISRHPRAGNLEGDVSKKGGSFFGEEALSSHPGAWGGIPTMRCVGPFSDKVPQAFRSFCRLHYRRRIYKIVFPYKKVL
jgi:hypothetical protein